MDSTMVASFMDELQKIAEGNVAEPAKALVGGMGANVMAKPLSTPGIGKATGAVKPGPAKTTNYTMVNSIAPSAAWGAGTSTNMVPPPPVRT